MASLHDELEKNLQDSNATPMFLPLEFLKAITHNFSTESELGRGGYGVVYKGVLRSGKIIAVKNLFAIHLLDDKTFRNEVSYLMEIKHPNVVQFIGYCAESSWETIKKSDGTFIWAEIPKRLLCFEYLCNESLGKYIYDESSNLKWNMRYEIIKGICSGLNFLHEECCLVHLDLKPENILMDARMIPKIADFGLSRMFGNQQSRIVTDNRVGSCGYMAPEYLNQGLITRKADIFSLGVIIIEIITGRRDYPYFHLDNPQSIVTSLQHYMEKVLGSWRNKFASTPKHKSLEKYTHQVKQCVTVALKCVDPSMEKRPTAKDIIQVFNAVDQTEAQEELSPVTQCIDKLLVLNTNTSTDLTPPSVVEDMLINKATTSKVVDEATSESMSPMLTESSTVTQNQEGAKAPSEILSSRDATTEAKISPHSDDDMLQIDPLELHFPFELNKQMSCSLDLTNETDSCIAFSIQKMSTLPFCIQPQKGIVWPHSKCMVDITLQQHEKAPRHADDFIMRSTKVNDGIAAEDITTALFNIDTGNVVDEVNLHVVFDTQPRTGSGGTLCELTTSPVELVEVPPRQLCFPYEPNKFIPCTLHLTNNTNEQMAFMLMKANKYKGVCFVGLPLYGIVPPSSTCTLVVIMDKRPNLPGERETELILLSIIDDMCVFSSSIHKSDWDWERCFQRAEKAGTAVMHKVRVQAVYARKEERLHEAISPLIKIMPMYKTYIPDHYMFCMDAHKTEPWIITSHWRGQVIIRNCNTQKLMCSYNVGVGSGRSIKFIAGKQWFVVGSADGSIRVYEYETGRVNRAAEVKMFHTCCIGFGSLAVHPTQPYVLASSQDRIQFWDGGRDWKLVRTFREHSGARQAAFNPWDMYSFASASADRTIKVWSIKYDESKYTLSGHSDKVNCLDFFRRGDQQYLITGSDDKTAKIWDLKERTCVDTLNNFASPVVSVVSHPTLPVLIAGTKDGALHLWSSTDFRLMRILHVSKNGGVVGLACLTGSRRVLIGDTQTVVSMVEIHDEEPVSSKGNNKILYELQTRR